MLTTRPIPAVVRLVFLLLLTPVAVLAQGRTTSAMGGP